jgi:serine/threonine-protein kinase
MAPQSVPFYEFGDFRLDCRRRILQRLDGTTVPLAPKAFDTLTCLVESSGTVLGKDALLQAVWPDVAVEENNLNQNISLLRRTLGEGRGEHRYIATVPGRGYRFVAEVRSAAAGIESGRSSDLAIAVLPFVNVSGDPEFDYFGDGLADELMTALSRLGQVRVAARSSAFAFKGRQVDVRQIARQLGVGLVLEGSLRKSGTRLRVTAQLIDAASGYNVWSERYDREMEVRDILDVQDDLTVAVLRALKVNLPGTGTAALTHATRNAQAHELYLKGRFHLFRMTRAGIETGLRHLERAIECDPSYALAHVGIAHAYRMYGLSLEMPPNEVWPNAAVAARTALELDDTLAEAHAVAAFNCFWHDWNWSRAEEHFKRAIRLNPTSADTHWMYAHVPSNLGRHEEALRLIGRARELDPLSGLINAMEGQFLLHAGRTDDAIARLREALELDPQSRVAHLFAASAFIERGLFDEAVAEARAARALTPSNTQGIALEAYANAKRGRRAEAGAAVGELLELSNGRYVSPYHVAIALCGVGANDDALTWLERGVEGRDPKMVFLNVEPKWAALRGDRRFVTLLKQMQFPSAQARS